MSGRPEMEKAQLTGEPRRNRRPITLLVVGEALQVGEDMLDLDQAFSQGGEREDRELVARVDGQHGQEPPAAGRTVGRRLDVWFSLRHGAEVLQDLVAEASLQVLEPGDSLLVHSIMQLLQLAQLLPILHLGVFEILDVCDAVSVPHAAGQHAEALATDGVDHGASVRQEVNTADDQHAAVVHEPFLAVADAHAELARAGVHAASYHEAIARLKDVQRTGHGGVGHGAHEDRDVTRQVRQLLSLLQVNLLSLDVLLIQVQLDHLVQNTGHIVLPQG